MLDPLDPTRPGFWVRAIASYTPLAHAGFGCHLRQFGNWDDVLFYCYFMLAAARDNAL